MKHVAVSGLYDNNVERPTKLRRRDSSSSRCLKTQQQEPTKPQPLSPFSSDINRDKSNLTAERADEICQWITATSDIDELEMSQPASKRSRSRSTSTDRGRVLSVSSAEDSENSSTRDAKSAAYKAANYVTILETKGCFMYQSSAGPVPEDIEFCKRLLRQPVETPQGTLFDDEFIVEFHNALRNRSEARLLVDFHPLLMPSAENQYIRGKTWLKNVVDGYNESWIKTEPIYGPKPQPDHARYLKWSTFSETQRRKLGVKSNEKSPYTAREDMYFPYLTAEIKCGNQALELADRQNMHSMCIALRGVVSLARAAGCLETVHRRILGFSISHELEGLRIYGHYPEIDEGKVLYFRWPVTELFGIWANENKWTCHRFVENLDREFLSIHTDRLMNFLAEIPDPEEVPLNTDIDVDDDVESQVSRTGSQERLYRRTASSQGRGLQPELRMMIQSLQQQLESQRLGEEKRAAEQRQREEKLLVEQREREDKLLAEQREREERLVAEQKRREEKLLAEQKELQDKLLAQLEQQRSREERLLVLLEQKGNK